MIVDVLKIETNVFPQQFTNRIIDAPLQGKKHTIKNFLSRGRPCSLLLVSEQNTKDILPVVVFFPFLLILRFQTLSLPNSTF
jgi:hypothetical protein